ncbi:MAG: HNH endonuclease [Roseibium sp.]
MIAGKRDLIVRELEEGTGATIAVESDKGGLRSAMRIWFGDLDEPHGPIAEIRPHGLRGHKVSLTFGNYAGAVIHQIKSASGEDVQLARALVDSIDDEIAVTIAGQSMNNWSVNDGSFQLTATLRHDGSPDEDRAVSRVCREVIVPVMAAMAELIGYEVIVEETLADEPLIEGAIKPATVNRRERNPRNRLLCIRLHGEVCAVCGLDPPRRYGNAGSIIEVHHLEPLSSLAVPRPYNPADDLRPLCPNCHRAVHTRRPVPWSIDELKDLMVVANG